ncbi:MAG: polymer-forming cytoskeletal protein [Iphinoe sp. HA4291-MV1]|jgi:hypothetical protein|nr:polymer-forming cytoskeletal protein [Iphinoe sp. HA4291-MV1]
MVLKDVNQRPRYFAGQYLLEEDFELEQDYHIDRQCRHNRLLHVSGIAEGLSVKLEKNTLTVSSGTAVDKYGQQIVLLNNQTVDLPSNNGEYILFIQYTEENDLEQSGTQKGYRRIVEKPSIKVDLVNNVPDSAIKLAKLAIAQGQITNPIDLNVREYSGLRLPSPTNEGLTLRSGGDQASNLAVLSGGFSVTDKVGIGTITPTAKLHIVDSFQDARGTTLILGSTDASNLRLGYDQGYSWIQSHGSKPLAINSLGNNVGIGTTNPTEKLEIGGNLKVNGNISATGNVGIGTTTTLTEKLEIGGNLKVSGNISATGNVGIGIGTATLTEKLEIGGNLKVSGNISATGNVGIGTTTAPSKKLQIESGELRVKASHNIDTADIGTFYRGDLTQGIGIGYNRIEAIGSIANQDILILPKGTGKVGIGTASPTEKLEISGGNLKVVNGNISAIDATLTGKVVIGTGSTVPIKKLQIESGELKVKASHDNGTADIGTFYRNNLTQGIGIGYNRIEAIGSIDNQDILILPKGTGKVGIGTASPTEKLEISGGNLKVNGNISAIDATLTGKVGIGTGSTVPIKKLQIESGELRVKASHNIDTADIGTFYRNNLTQGIGIGYNRIEAIGSIDNQDILILPKGTGKVGIGTASPTEKLEISDGNLKVSGNISATGNVGIGTTTTLTEKLEIGGNLKVSGNISATGNVGIGTASPAANLQVRNTITVYNKDNFDFSKTALLVNSKTHNGGSSPAAAESVLTLAREGVANQSWGNMVDFQLSNYRKDNDGTTDAITQLDLYLTKGQFSQQSVMSLRGNGNVKINGVLEGNAGLPVGVNNNKYPPTGAVLREMNGEKTIAFDYVGDELKIFMKEETETNWREVKTFVINHPQNQSKYLIHGTLEGPEAAVYYRGTGQLVNGKTEITLPDYFEALTRQEGRTIILTNINGFDQLMIRKIEQDKIRNGKFLVVSDNPNSFQEFDWEVKAVRQDVLPLVVEPDKKDLEVKGYGPYTYAIPKNP